MINQRIGLLAGAKKSSLFVLLNLHFFDGSSIPMIFLWFVFYFFLLFQFIYSVTVVVEESLKGKSTLILLTFAWSHTGPDLNLPLQIETQIHSDKFKSDCLYQQRPPGFKTKAPSVTLSTSIAQRFLDTCPINDWSVRMHLRVSLFPLRSWVWCLLQKQCTHRILFSAV